jgi:hypothetical protein
MLKFSHKKKERKIKMDTIKERERDYLKCHQISPIIYDE